MKPLQLITYSFLAFLLSFNVAQAGFGVSPGSVDEDKLVPGAVFENIIYLVQGNPQDDLPVRVSVESQDIKEWFSFENGTEFTIPKNVQQFPLKVKVNVPEDADLGDYKAFVRINTVPPEGTQDGQVSISIGGRVDYHLIVGDDVVKEYSVLSTKILNIKENQNPKVEFKIKNTGNVSAAPVAASFELFNKFGTVRLGFSEVDGFEKVAAFSESTQILDFPIDVKFAPGEYWGDIKVYGDEGQIIGSVRSVFNVHEITFLDKLLVYAKWVGIIIIVIVILFPAIKVIKRFLKNKRSNI